MTAPPSTDSVRQYVTRRHLAPEPTTGARGRSERSGAPVVAQREVVGPTNSESSGSEMKTFRVGIRLASGAWFLTGCVALVGLLRESDAQLVGWLLMVPAMVLGLLGVPPGVLFTVF